MPYEWNRGKYAWPDTSFEISGYGEPIEEECKWMISKGLEWLDKHPKVKKIFQDDPDHHDVNNSYGGLRKYLLTEVEKQFPKCGGPSFHTYDKTLYAIRSMVKYGFLKSITESMKARKERGEE